MRIAHACGATRFASAYVDGIAALLAPVNTTRSFSDGASVIALPLTTVSDGAESGDGVFELSAIRDSGLALRVCPAAPNVMVTVRDVHHAGNLSFSVSKVVLRSGESVVVDIMRSEPADGSAQWQLSSSVVSTCDQAITIAPNVFTSSPGQFGIVGSTTITACTERCEFHVALTDFLPSTLGVSSPSSMNVTILESHPGCPQWATLNVATPSEGGSVSTVLMRTGGSDGILDLLFTTESPSGASLSQLIADVQPAAFADGVVAATATWTAHADDISEEAQTFLVNVTVSGESECAATTLTVVIPRNDFPGDITLGVPNTLELTEGADAIISLNHTGAVDCTLPLTVTCVRAHVLFLFLFLFACIAAVLCSVIMQRHVHSFRARTHVHV